MTDNINNEPGHTAVSDIALDFANRLKIARGKLHLSQKEFAARLEVAGSYLSEIESGKTRPGFDFFYKTSKIFKINPVYLLHGEGVIFLEAEKSWYEGIDFGSLNSEVKELVWHMEKSPTVAHAILEFFSRYLYSNQDLIETEIKRNQDKK
ncbi:MAG TPA: helix-turn-helix transcriptional regulator [Candidatus Deferrimicrobium sp.]|nr:helix-turn-helix transcriptional regulator [Candidatus Kapabacteria bacterium]HLP58320.1 helix-turn-helix transcriptional regulator [Candidatus Deferrimicrobium sp.]